MRKLILILLSIVLTTLYTKAEGTKQLCPSSTDTVGLYINASDYYDFARYGSSEEERLYIRIENPTNEKFYLGFSQPYYDGHDPDTRDSAYFRILDPNGTIVYGPMLINAATANIANWSEAVAGPSPIAGASGYVPFEFDPAGLSSGNYYIEFSREANTYTTDDKIVFQYFDITVANKGAFPAAIDGRVFAKNWGFHLPSPSQGTDPTYSWFDRPFNGHFHVYTQEGYVSKIDFQGSGFQPAAFNISFNDKGTTQTGDVEADRRSQEFQSNNPQFEVFLNDPDPAVFPSGTFGELLTDSTRLIGCPETGYFFKVVTSKTGIIELLLDIDQASGVGIYDPNTADRFLVISVDDQLTDTIPGKYFRYIPWDGLDGLGNLINTGVPVSNKVTFSQGVYHIPIYDAEFNLNGFTAEIVRPTPPPSYTLGFYYDDSNITEASDTTYETQGCAPPCHAWNNRDFGDVNTINTYWFAKQESDTKALSVIADCGGDSDSDGVYNSNDIDWDNDGVFDEFGKTGNAQHDYGTAGVYTVRIRGQFPRIYINDDPSMREKLISVDQWGNIGWTSMSSSFRGANNLVINATDTPDLSSVINMTSMFSGASSIDQNINSWDVSNVQFMGFLFDDTPFNQPLDNWDVSNVRDMKAMFQDNSSFNQPLSMWNVSNVEDMSFMFNFAEAFNQNINNWNVSNVEDMSSMFKEANAFDSPVDSWDVSGVTNMFNMFFHADIFNQPLNSWNVSNVQTMERMFNNALLFNQPLNNWNVSNVTNMFRMFTFIAFDQDISSWDVSNVTDMGFIFQGSTLSTENYDAILNAWANLTLQSNVDFHGGNSNYCNSEAARNTLINAFGWNITDGGLDCSGLSIAEFNNDNISLYPNPTQGIIHIDSTAHEITKIEIYSVTGQLVKTIGLDNRKINIENFKSGLYFIKLSSNDRYVIKKVMKK